MTDALEGRCSIQLSYWGKCTRSGNRTRTPMFRQQILSLSCLPIPPSEHLFYAFATISSNSLSINSNCLILTETNTQQIFKNIEETEPEVLVIDSIQTLHTNTIEASPGSISQIRQCTAELIKFAKETNTPVILGADQDVPPTPSATTCG